MNGLIAYSGNKNSRRGFTLVELLVVIAIICVLVSMLFGGMVAMREAARRKKTAVFEQTLMHAIKAYRNDNGSWPGQTQGDNDNCYINVLNILGASGSGLTNNARNINYLEIPAGMFDGKSFIDPWKQPLVIGLDENMDGIVEFSATMGVTTVNTNVTDGVAIFSWGRDARVPGLRVYTWQ
jgi:prepilin-type N-terminal cleavage/methylation domain-containing protein